MPNTTNRPSADDYDRPSKSQVKRDMLMLQELGKQLVELPLERLKHLALADPLFEAIRAAQRITSREGKRRQIHYVGKLMRTADAQAIQQQLDTWQHGSREATRAMHRLEAVRDMLIKDDNALTQFLNSYPDIDVQPLRALIRAARKEAQHNATLEPGQAPQRKHYRALFQALKSIDINTESQ